MAPVPVVAPQTSLQKLLALDTDHQDFSTRLRHAGQIAGVNSKSFNQPRAEWVLRWLLEKFKSEDELGNQARFSADAWQSLTDLVKSIPECVSARSLNSSHILSAIEKALSQLATSPDSAPVNRQSASNGKKRKRGPSVANGSTESPSPNSAGDVFASIGGFLQTVWSLSKETKDSDDPTAAAHMQSVLRTSTTQAANLLKLWLSQIALNVKESIRNESNSLSPILPIWKLRAPEATDEFGTSSAIFCSECLVPALRLLFSTDIDDITSAQLQELLAVHLWYAAHQFFLNKKRSKDRFKDYKALQSFLSPLKEEIMRTPELLNTLPKLLDQAFACTGKQKAKEWTEILFAALSDCAGLPVEPQGYDKSVADPNAVETERLLPNFEVLKDLLAILHRRKKHLPADALKKMISEYSGLLPMSKGPRGQVQWKIVSLVLRMDGDVFLNNPRPTESGDAPQFGPILLRKLSKLGSDDTGQISVGEEILIPLCQAYVRARDMTVFVAAWSGELESSYEKIKHDGRTTLIWTSDVFGKALRSMLEPALTSKQILRVLSDALIPLAQLSSEIADDGAILVDLRDSGAAPKASAALVVLDVFLHAISQEETIKQAADVLRVTLVSLMRLILDTPDRMVVPDRCWRVLFRILQLLSETQPQAMHECFQTDLLAKAKKHASSEFSPYAKEAFLFLVGVCSATVDDPEVGQAAKENLLWVVDSVFSEKSVKRIMKTLRKQSERSTGMESQLRWALHGLEAIVWRHQLLSLLEPKQLNSIITALVGLVALGDSVGSYLPGEAAGVFTDVLFAFQDIFVSFTPKLTAHYFRVLKSFIRSDEDGSMVETALTCLLDFPPEAVAREERESLIDCVVEYTTEHLTMAESCLAKLNNVATRFLHVSSPTAKLCTDVDTFTNLEEKLSGLANVQLLPEVRALFAAVFDQVLSEPGLLRNQQFASQICIHFKTQLEKQRKKPRHFQKRPLCLLAMTLWIPRASQFYADTKKLQDFYCEVLSEPLESLVLQRSDRDALKKAERLSSKVDIIDALLTEGVRFLSSLPAMHLVEPRLFELSLNDAVMLYEATCQEIIRLGHVNIVERFYNRVGVSRALLKVIAATRKAVQALTPTGRADLFVKAMDSKAEVAVWADLQLQADVLETLEYVSASQDMTRKLRAALPTICDRMRDLTSVDEFNAWTACVASLLKKQHWLTTQYGVESSLSALITLLSPNSPHLPPDAASHLYDSACSISTWLIQFHRKRLGGRMHIVVLLLQSLVGCLFTPHPHSSSAFAAQLPWLPARTPAPRLGALQARSCAAVFTTLCDPTVSSASGMVKRSSANAELVDETKKAKAYAGEFIGPVVLHFCRMMLDGYLQPDVRKELLPGVWAMVASMDMDYMRAMNASASIDVRDIWTSLYQEWERFGR